MISSYAPEAAVKLERFKEIWLLDTEFSALPGYLPRVVCVVARELRSGQLIRLWEHELASRWPVFDRARFSPRRLLCERRVAGSPVFGLGVAG